MVLPDVVPDFPGGAWTSKIKSGFLASVPFLAAFGGVLCSGVLSDFGAAPPGPGRKLPIILGLLISTSMIGANFTDSTLGHLLFGPGLLRQRPGVNHLVWCPPWRRCGSWA